MLPTEAGPDPTIAGPTVAPPPIPVPNPVPIEQAPAGAPVAAAPPPVIPVTEPVTIEGQVPPAVNPVQEAQRIVQQTQQLGKEEVANQTEKSALEQQQAKQKELFDQASEKALGEFQQRQELHRQAAQAQIDNLRNEYETKPFTSLWSRLSTGQRVATALSVLAAGISWNSNHTNRALDMLDKAESEDLDIQKEQHASLLHDIQLAMEGKKDLEANQLHELSDWQALQAAKWQAISSKLNSLLASNKGNIDVTAVKKAALEATAKANQGWEGAETAKATANHMDAAAALSREEVKNQESVRRKNNAEAARDEAQARGEIGPNGPTVNIDLKLAGEIDKRLKADTELPKLLATKEELEKGIANLKPGANGFQVQGAIDAYVTAATKGKATKFQVENFKKRLGGLWTTIEGNIEAGRSGNYTPEQIGTIQKAFNDSLTHTDNELGNHRRQHTENLKKDPLLGRVPQMIDSAIGERFGDAGKFVPPAGAVLGLNRATGQKVYKLPNGSYVDLEGNPVK